VIRPALPSDAADVGALIIAAYQGYVARLGKNPQPMDDDYTLLIADGQVWVMESDGELAGVLVCQKAEDHLLIRTVGITPERQRTGFGSSMMKHAEQIAKDSGVSVLRLYTNETMTGNAELYARLGYHETHRKGPEGKQVIYMTKVL
jgi:GNAT superfamily N-acetyltransferase